MCQPRACGGRGAVLTNCSGSAAVSPAHAGVEAAATTSTSWSMCQPRACGGRGSVVLNNIIFHLVSPAHAGVEASARSGRRR